MQFLPLVLRYAAGIWSHRWKALAVAWLICAAGWTVVTLLPNQYQSNARIYADADAVLGTLLRGIALDSSPAGEVETLQRTLLSRPNLEAVIAATGLAHRVPGNPSIEVLIDGLARNFRITNQTRNLFTISYRTTDPQLAFDIVQATVTRFVEAATGNDRRQFESAREFLLDQLTFYEGRLREAERRRAEFQARYIDLLPSAANGGLSRLESGRGHLARLRGELADARTRRALTLAQLEAAPAFLASEPGDGSAGGRLVEAERNLRELRLRYTEAHPAVVSARQLVAELRAQAGAGAGRMTRPNPMHEQLRARMVDADVEVASLERRVRESEAEVEHLEAVARSEPEVLAQFTNLDRDYNVLRRHYEELLQRREAIRIADAARTDSDRVKLEVVDPPTLPTRPAGPNRPLFAAGVLLLGLGAGLAVAFLLTQFDGRFYTTHDLRRLGLPVLGSVSSVRERLPGHRLAATGFGMAFLLLFIAFGAVLFGPETLRGLVA